MQMILQVPVEDYPVATNGINLRGTYENQYMLNSKFSK